MFKTYKKFSYSYTVGKDWNELKGSLRIKMDKIRYIPSFLISHSHSNQVGLTKLLFFGVFDHKLSNLSGFRCISKSLCLNVIESQLTQVRMIGFDCFEYFYLNFGHNTKLNDTLDTNNPSLIKRLKHGRERGIGYCTFRFTRLPTDHSYISLISFNIINL